ncbi:hypothetical protein SBA2_350034 [Acidobacteriia bacterium SbA2]|nr:hypothetical protein SBA2_350034 [Acidobacteriia bacterium SbA2]
MARPSKSRSPEVESRESRVKRTTRDYIMGEFRNANGLDRAMSEHAIKSTALSPGRGWPATAFSPAVVCRVRVGCR